MRLKVLHADMQEETTYDNIGSWGVSDVGLLSMNKTRELTAEEKTAWNRQAMKQPGGLAANGAPDAVEIPIAAWAPGSWAVVEAFEDDE